MIETKIFKELIVDDSGTTKKVLATSYSQIDMFLSCPKKWQYTYLMGLRKEERAEALSLGTSVHETLEQYFLKVKEGYEWDMAEAKDVLSENMEKNDIPFANENNKDIATEQHMNMMEGLVEGTSELAKFMQDKTVIACEKDFIYKVPLPFTVVFNKEYYREVYIVGAIDFIVKDSKGGIHVMDFKSGKKQFEPKKLKTNLQLPIYSLIVKQLYGKLPVQCSYYFTRLDVIQDVEPIVEDDSHAEKVYFRSGARKGELKHKQRTVDDVNNEMINIFKMIYQPEQGYGSSSTPLCSWCPYGLYGDRRCQEAMFYIRKDIPLPKKRINIEEDKR